MGVHILVGANLEGEEVGQGQRNGELSHELFLYRQFRLNPLNP